MLVSGLRTYLSANASASGDVNRWTPNTARIDVRMLTGSTQCDCTSVSLTGGDSDVYRTGVLTTGPMVVKIPRGSGSISFCLQIRNCAGSNYGALTCVCSQCVQYSYFRQGTVFS